jgi:hypothetical protein
MGRDCAPAQWGQGIDDASRYSAMAVDTPRKRQNRWRDALLRPDDERVVTTKALSKLVQLHNGG